MKEMVNDLLASPRARERGYFNPKSVASLLQERNRGTRDNAHSLWAPLMLEVWRRIFIDHEPAASGAGVKGAARSVI
jgi:asparagine synthase (glutamine-hydrolysing)